MADQDQGYNITPPADISLRNRLVAKLEEYKLRIIGDGEPWDHRPSDFAHKVYLRYRDSCYKAFVLETVLASDKQVFVKDLFREASKKWGSDLNVDNFNNAWGVIKEYCEGSLSSTTGGTGLPILS
jgi:hypothetical protein